MIKKFTTGEYVAENVNTGDQYYFQWRPTKKDLVYLEYRENTYPIHTTIKEYNYNFGWSNWSIRKLIYEPPDEYGYKLRYR